MLLDASKKSSRQDIGNISIELIDEWLEKTKNVDKVTKETQWYLQLVKANNGQQFSIDTVKNEYRTIYLRVFDGLRGKMREEDPSVIFSDLLHEEIYMITSIMRFTAKVLEGDISFAWT